MDKQKQLVLKAKQVWFENSLEDYLIPVYSSPYDPWGYNVGGTQIGEKVDYDGFEFYKRDTTVKFVGPNGETGEFTLNDN